MNKIRWGILGLGNIAHKFAVGLTFVENAVLQGVASSNSERSKEFADKYGAKMSFMGYEDLAKSPDIDVIYIASYSSLHYEHAKLCIENGKHVLCEKPTTTSVAQTKELFELAKSKKLFFMEALWTRFFPSIAYLEELKSTKVFGEIKKIDVSFGFAAKNNPDGRLLNAKLGGGAMFDIGIYPLFLCQLLLGNPSEIIKDIEFGPTGVDIATKINARYNNAKSSMWISFKEELPNEAIIHFENAVITLKKMWHCPTELTIDTGKLKKLDIDWKGNGYNYEAQFVTDTLLEGNTKQDFMPDSFTISLIEQIEDIIKR